VLTIDLRGNGESDKPIDADAYAINRLTDDVLGVAKAADAKQFAVWGYSYGANVGRYLPSRSKRVTRLVIIGIGFGPAAPDPSRRVAAKQIGKAYGLWIIA